MAGDDWSLADHTSSDLIFEGETAIARSLFFLTSLHMRSKESESGGVEGPAVLVEAWEWWGVENGSGAIGRV